MTLPGIVTFEHQPPSVPGPSALACPGLLGPRQRNQKSVPGQCRALDPDGEAREALESHEIAHPVQNVKRGSSPRSALMKAPRAPAPRQRKALHLTRS